MNKIAFLASAACLAVLNSGCVLLFKLPVSRFDSPEVAGETGKISFSGGLGAANEIVLTPDYSYYLVTPQGPGIERSNYDTRLGASFGLAEQFEVSAKSSLTSEPTFLQLKYQLLGEPRLKAAPGFSLAFTGAVGGIDSQEYLTVGSSSSRVKLSVHAYDLAVIAGHRLSESLMFYGGGFFTAFTVDGEQMPFNASTTQFEGSGNHTGANLGAELGSGPVRLRAEFAYGRTRMGTSASGKPYFSAYAVWNL